MNSKKVNSSNSFCLFMYADFLANKDSIDYFMEVYYLKRNRYAQFTRSKKKPLGGTFAMLSECYWPGVVSCCGIVLNSSESFKKHIAKKHTPPSKQDPVLSTVDSSYLPITSPPSKRRRDQREGTPSSMRLTPTPAVTATSLFSAKGTVKETRGLNLVSSHFIYPGIKLNLKVVVNPQISDVYEIYFQSNLGPNQLLKGLTSQNGSTSTSKSNSETVRKVFLI